MTDTTQAELRRQTEEAYPPEEVELRLLFDSAKRDAVAMFKNDHDDGDTAIYQFISEIVPLINAHTNKQIEAVLDRLEYAYSNPIEDKGYVSLLHVIEAERNKLKERTN